MKITIALAAALKDRFSLTLTNSLPKYLLEQEKAGADDGVPRVCSEGYWGLGDNCFDLDEVSFEIEVMFRLEL